MKKIIRKFLKYTGLVTMTAAFLFGAAAGCSSKPSSGPSEPSDMGVVVEPPQAGSPTDYSALENIEFIKGKLAAREYYHIYSVSNVTATAGVKQKVEGSKDFLDGILVTETISYGTKILGFIETPSVALQRFFGETEVLVRSPASQDSSQWNLNMDWSDAAPTVLGEEEYRAAYGLRADELSDFVISEETIVSAEELQKEGENYVLTITLDNEKAPAFYVNQMKTMGNLDDYPVFETIRITFTFDKDWAILSMQTEEKYSSKKIITASCSGGSVVTYSYERSDVDVSAYDEYFCKYGAVCAEKNN